MANGGVYQIVTLYNNIMNKPIACQYHNHDHCIDEALTSARDLCLKKQVRLTRQREKVLELIWQSHKPLGAYALMEMLSVDSTRRVAPPTVYRALDFLLEQHLIHRINSLNAFIGCPDPHHSHQNQFLICKQCGIATECINDTLNTAIEQTGAAAGFAIDQHSVEIIGFCPNCQQQESQTEQSTPHE